MTKLKLCLLISDDPDDYQVLTEAFKEIDKSFGLVIAVDPITAANAMAEEKLKPDFIIIDTTAENMDFMPLLSKLKGHDSLQNIPLIVYAEMPYQNKLGNVRPALFINKNESYSQVINSLQKLLKDFIE